MVMPFSLLIETDKPFDVVMCERKQDNMNKS
jgi:hypothetical protein